MNNGVLKWKNLKHLIWNTDRWNILAFLSKTFYSKTGRKKVLWLQLVLLGLWFCFFFFSFKLIAKFCLYLPVNLMPQDSVVHQICGSFGMKNLCSQILCLQGANEGALTSGSWCARLFWLCLLPTPMGSSAAAQNLENHTASAIHPPGSSHQKSCPGPMEFPQCLQLPTTAHPWVAEGRDLNQEETSLYLELGAAPSSDDAGFK